MKRRDDPRHFLAPGARQWWRVRGARDRARPYLPQLRRGELCHGHHRALCGVYVRVAARREVARADSRVAHHSRRRRSTRLRAGGTDRARARRCPRRAALCGRVPAAQTGSGARARRGIPRSPRRDAGSHREPPGSGAGERGPDLSGAVVAMGIGDVALRSLLSRNLRAGAHARSDGAVPLDSLRSRHAGGRGDAGRGARERRLARAHRADQLDGERRRRRRSRDPHRAHQPAHTLRLHAGRRSRARGRGRRSLRADGSDRHGRHRHRHAPVRGPDTRGAAPVAPPEWFGRTGSSLRDHRSPARHRSRDSRARPPAAPAARTGAAAARHCSCPPSRVPRSEWSRCW